MFPLLQKDATMKSLWVYGCKNGESMLQVNIARKVKMKLNIYAFIDAVISYMIYLSKITDN